MCTAVSNINILVRDTQVGSEGRAAFWGRKIAVEPGSMYVFTTGLRNTPGAQEVIRGGEIVYVSDEKDMLSRRIIVINENAGRINIHCQRAIPGLSAAQEDNAVFSLTIDLEVEVPMMLVQRFASQLAQIDAQVKGEVEGNLLHFIQQTLAIWSQPDEGVMRIVHQAVNQIVGQMGLNLRYENIKIVRKFPDRMAQLHAECYFADMRLIEQFESIPVQDRVRAMCAAYPRIFVPTEQANHDTGNIEIVCPLASKWLANVQVGQGHIANRGRPFFELVCDRIINDVDSGVLHDFVVQCTQGNATVAYIEALYTRKNLGGVAVDLMSSIEIVRDNFRTVV